ncbi:2OG-Fe(II) oxygenase [Caldimonas thermodepolymerans]|jgi:2OG-Fe(II) oxygenase superfamily.|uniref:2-oxoglutarate-dependent dioxygenase n=1 Tax=Caldimonas thermodepolymerans TaxID=215580 RepID=A0A2S5T3A1_9BURK|nr:2OG-Fe(II) oxygenase [Caldimonas thermodepolymerans]PPE69471.1 2-oxoglutarate-dependent dioxygenase [Caldimonas thermodepolymerans]QPC32821.1 2OG-Fe(II) oxygenase [Caldimonas thermodepolymerans]RDI03592.1 prolyl 4-hydroxylase [Caldimonas thermodepolymerans]TCP09561.1 prolyl 4-hydroxylase [Caldimonas thermodepolymerans]UZG49581.1 2OG-Fe(II) oxygenase [Caldimonas thermodepolymerans]
MSTQQITPELRQWIIEQATAGHSAHALLKAMVERGWDEDVATDAMEEVLQAYLRERGLTVPAVPAATQPPPASLVPEPDLAGSPSTVWAGDREVQVVMSMHDPRVVVFGGFLSDEECDELMALAAPRLVRSETVKTDTGTSEVNEARTSDGMFFRRGENALCERIEQRIATLLRWPVENGEGLQVLRYRPGAEYKPHYDYFDPAQPGTPTILRRGGQRVGTLVMYLNTPARGGGTTFPDARLEVAPVKGHAVFFSYARPHPSTRTLHGGAPVLEGEKWVATKWLRAGRFE